MSEPQERHYNINKLNLLFALSSAFLLFTIVWLFWDDYARDWKEIQKEFRTMEIEKTRVKYDAESNLLKQNEEYQTLLRELEDTQKTITAQCSNLEEVRGTLSRLQAENDLLKHKLKIEKAKLDAARYRYEEAVDHQHAMEEPQKQFDELQANVHELTLAVEQSDQKLKTQTDTMEDCQKQSKELARQQETLEKQASLLARKLSKIDPGAMSVANYVANLIRDLPVIDFANPNYKIEQIVLKDIHDDVNFLKVPRVDRCITCHLGIANPDYSNAPQPFRTHPNLELYIGKNSPHPMEEFGCTVCHEGRGRGTDFINSAHTPSSAQQKKEWEEKYHWESYHHWETPMYPMAYVEAGCFKCHAGESVIKGAEQLNLGLHLIEKAGCYACHLIDKYKDWPKPGPDLTHLADKTSQDWVYRWIADPKSFRHNTWMPSFFGQSNNSDPESVVRAEQEIHAMVHFLFANAKEFPLNTMPVQGDAKRGEEIVTSIGCFGCHNIQQASPAGHGSKESRTRQALRREHGPNLIGLGTKTSPRWLYNWLKDPDRYHPETRMPNLRLTDQEAADAAAFLVEDQDSEFSAKPIPPVNEKILDEIIRTFAMKTETIAQVNRHLAQMNRDDKLHYAGEKLIAHYGCYSCHTIAGFENFKPIGTELTEEGSKPPDKLDFGFIDIEHTRQAWFTQKLKEPRIFDHNKVKAQDEKLRMPNYYFSDKEIEAIVTVLLGFVKDRPESPKLKPRTTQNLYIEEGQKLVREFNCQGCHWIEGEGGAIQPTVVQWLMTYDNRSENEAEALMTSFSPPNLIGEGKKVHAQWLFEFLHEPTAIRPWLKVRMPTYTFNAAHLNTLVKYFNALDSQEFPFSEMVDTSLTPEEYEDGQKLFSNEYFGCAQCHIVGDKPPAGSAESWAPNFALAKHRLRPQWFSEWLRDPQVLLPGTKMPTFFDPANFAASGPEDILEGDENKQIEVLRNYILTLAEEAPAEKENLEESPTAQPIKIPQ